jgi:hypothetical protein
MCVWVREDLESKSLDVQAFAGRQSSIVLSSEGGKEKAKRGEVVLGMASSITSSSSLL